jgi:PAS domain S-box-containing protein
VFLFPYLLFRFAAAQDRPARRTEGVAGALAGAVLVGTLLLPSFPAEGAPRPGWLSAYLAVVLLEWTVISLIVAVKLWRAGRGQPTGARRRMRGLSLGASSLSVVIVAAGVAPSAGDGPMKVAIQLLTCASALLFYLAFAPPAILRNAWRQPEQEMLRLAMGDLKAVSRVEEVAACLLPRVVGMVGGLGAALVDQSGRLVGSHGQTPGLGDGLVPADAGAAPEVAVPGSVRLPLSTGTLLVWTSPYTPLFGRQEFELLRALASLAELALERVHTAERDSQLAAVVDASGDAIVSTTLDGTIRSWNPAAGVTYGRSAEETIGQPLSIVAQPDCPDELPELLRRVAEGNRVGLETRHLRQDGGAISVALTAAPLRDRAGAVVGASVIAHDISERKLAEGALQEAKETADRANHAKSEYLSRMSHELRTPLNAILGFGQLLQLDGLTEEQRESVDQILRGGRHLLGLINEVLDISRIETGSLALSREAVNLYELLKETIDLIRPLAAERELGIEAPSAEGCSWTVQADRQRLRQVLLNLASNAVKYNRHGGTISFTCQPAPDGRVRILVRDTGPGISADNMQRLFTPFDRLGAEQTDIQGTGMGLALSKRLLEAMGGTLTAHSLEGQGSTFTLELALAEDPLEHYELATPAQSLPVPDRGSGPERTVLYVEDNPSNLRLVERVLGQRGGVRLLTATQGQLVQDLVRQHRPDLVLLDLHLPDIAGEEVLRRLQADPETADLPVVVVSADATAGHIQRLLAAGARQYLTKPLDVSQFLEVVDELLQGAHR